MTSVAEGEIVARLGDIACHVQSALALADEAGDALLGAKLCDCLVYVESALATPGA